MRRSTRIALFSALLLAQTGCIQAGLLGEEDLLTTLFGSRETESQAPDKSGANAVAAAGGGQNGTGTSAPADGADAGASGTIASGNLAGKSDYQLFELPGVAAGDEITLADAKGRYDQSLFTVVLFDAEMSLIYRTASFPAYTVRHVAREPTPRLFLGVSPTYETSGGDFVIRVTRREAVGAPAPAPQTVYLNFAGAEEVEVYTRGPVSFGPIDGARIDPNYAGRSSEIKQAIFDALVEDYAQYNVLFYTSDEGPPPTGPHSTIHFGGAVSGLLGLADSVDLYNTDATQNAIIYVDNFEPYSVMRLTPAEMGVMIGNVASHELGHLLGLYHTRNPSDIMDTTGDAWDLAGSQQFGRVELADSVFPVGMEDSPALLSVTVGLRPGATDALRFLPPEKLRLRAAVRDLVEVEMPVACGLCADPAH